MWCGWHNLPFRRLKPKGTRCLRLIPFRTDLLPFRLSKAFSPPHNAASGTNANFLRHAWNGWMAQSDFLLMLNDILSDFSVCPTKPTFPWLRLQDTSKLLSRLLHLCFAGSRHCAVCVSETSLRRGSCIRRGLRLRTPPSTGCLPSCTSAVSQLNHASPQRGSLCGQLPRSSILLALELGLLSRSSKQGRCPDGTSPLQAAGLAICMKANILSFQA
mmetsp:Transcript_10836/g.24550  ORF Transcript_10836/g.24550 Transcript_10836/m.24550 type:complete len:216 (-) Transcript_10836:1681-2328(-)